MKTWYIQLNQKIHPRKICSIHFDKEQKQMHFSCNQDFDETAEGDLNFLKTIVTDNESWCFMHEPQTKRQFLTWLSQTW